jgi:hypothetical protein
MAHHLTNLELTEFQKIFLAKAVNAGCLDSYKKVTTNSIKLTNAVDLLDELDVIDYKQEQDTVKINDTYHELLVQSDIIDDTGNLTDNGQKLAKTDVDKNTITTESLQFKNYLKVNSWMN